MAQGRICPSLYRGSSLLHLLIMPALLCSGDKVDVYVLMGQSNMLGEGKIGPDNVNGSLGYAVKTEHKYPYLWNHSSNTWAVREDVRYVEVIGSGNSSFEHSNLAHNEFMTVTGKTIGPELGIGNYVGNATKNRVMILKACIGNRALGWDLLPPGSPGWEYKDKKNVTWEYAGYHQSPAKWQKGHNSKAYWLDGGRAIRRRHQPY
ncbi:uncharacterized protein [Oscarella lobularis]|uniref:uncharacterized protein isoform X1 n=1 Tax=Oscarella lobularis TaxID=121494 RepID=UPI003313A14B